MFLNDPLGERLDREWVRAERGAAEIASYVDQGQEKQIVNKQLIIWSHCRKEFSSYSNLPGGWGFIFLFPQQWVETETFKSFHSSSNAHNLNFDRKLS